MATDGTHHSVADRPEHVAAPIGPDEAAQALRNGPVGAFVVAGSPVALLFIGWLPFFFLRFIPPGPVGLGRTQSTPSSPAGRSRPSGAGQPDREPLGSHHA